MRLLVLLLLASLTTAQCEKNSWIIEKDGITGVVSKEGKPVRHATVHLSSPNHEYNTETDSDGRFSIWPVPVGKYSFAVKGWGEGEVEMQGWHHRGIQRPALLFSKHKQCLMLVEVVN
jgi:hypothetical protein